VLSGARNRRHLLGRIGALWAGGVGWGGGVEDQTEAEGWVQMEGTEGDKLAVGCVESTVSLVVVQGAVHDVCAVPRRCTFCEWTMAI
jgi:hypothetical protein